MPTFVSPKFPADKLEHPSYTDLVDVFEDQMHGWYLDPIGELLCLRGGDFAASALMMSYFEGIEIFFRGSSSKGRSREFFTAGFLRLFPGSHHKVIDAIYDQVRCGFAHDSMFRNRVYFSRLYNQPFVISVPRKDGLPDAEAAVESILINPERLHASIQNHLEEYVTILRSGRDISIGEAFERSARERWAIDEPARVIALGPEDLLGFT